MTKTVPPEATSIDAPIPRRSSGAAAYAMLTEAIEAGTLPAGARLRELELAARFGLSRTPVREALKRLEVEGLVTHEANFGAVVTQLDAGRTRELYFVRELMEGAAARLAATHATPDEIALLRRMVADDRAIAAQPQRLAANNKRFHRQIHAAARNHFLDGMLENMRLSLVLLAGTTLAVGGRGSEAVDEHERIVAALERRDPDAAEAAARAHIAAAFRTRLILLAGQS